MGLVEQALDEVLLECSRQPLQKANYGLLQKACILSSLSLRVYDLQLTDRPQEACNVQLTRLPTAVASSPSINLDDSHSAVPEATLLSGPQEGMPAHAVWAVKDLGVVVAFRGTASMQDVFADVSFPPMQLAGTDISVNGAIYTAAAKTISAVQTAYDQASQQSSNNNLPLYLTGSNAGSAAVM